MRRTDLQRRATPSSLSGREVLLYVEDDDDNWEVAQLRMSASYELLRARNAEEACSLWRERGGEISLVLMDIELRGSDLNGVELTQLLRGEPVSGKTLPAYARNLRPCGRPIVFVTAHSARHTKVRLMLAGAEQVIAKPVNFEDLQAAVAELTESRTIA